MQDLRLAFRALRATPLVSAVAAYSDTEKATLMIGGEPLPVDCFFVSGDFFDTLGVSPFVGRLFTLADDSPGGGPNGPVAVLSYKLWQERFGGAVSVIGSTAWRRAIRPP